MHTANTELAFAMHCSDDTTPPLLEAVQASGRLDGVLFTMTLRQTYRNPGPRPLELLYTFPLHHQAVLLGIAAEFDNHRIEGQVMPRHQAEAVYEAALAEGDAPVLLEVAGNGLHTASLGNLLPGERVVLELRYAQMLAFEQGRLRLVVPTTIAPRHGNPEASGMGAHQVPETALGVEYPLALEVTVTGSLASGRIECATHAHAVARAEQGLRLTLAEGARLDRDVVLVLTPKDPRPDLLVTGRDTQGHTVAVAAFQLPPGSTREAISLALLVDCSGSMGGDSIASARRALLGMTGMVGPRDQVSFSRFGSHVEHMLRPMPCTPAARGNLERAVDTTDATLGGTEMAAALREVFGLWPADHGADVLLITDGEIWNAEDLVTTARQGGHRVFAIGVGSAPAEGVLRRLAEATGGACEFATPGESLEAAAARMVARIRQVPRMGLRVDWGLAPAWEVALAPGGSAGDTVLAWAGFQRGGPLQARLLADDPAGPGDSASQAHGELAQTCVTTASSGADLARMAASRRLADAGADLALQLALDHQLVTAQTHCVLVHRRAEDERPLQPAEVRKVQQMLAAGWGGTGSATVEHFASSPPPLLAMSLDTPSVWRCSRVGSAQADMLSVNRMDDVEIPAFLRRQQDPETTIPLDDVARGVADHLKRGGAPDELPAVCKAWPLSERVLALIELLVACGLAEARCWLLLAAWIAARPGQDGDPVAEAVLEPLLGAVALTERGLAWKTMDRMLGSDPGSRPQVSRARRLGLALNPKALWDRSISSLDPQSGGGHALGK